MIAAIVAPVGIRNIAMMRACLVSGLAADLDGAGADRLRAAGLAVFRAVERVAAFDLILGLVTGYSEVHAAPSAAPPQPRPGNYPAGQDPQARLSRPGHHSNAPIKPKSQSILSKIVAHFLNRFDPESFEVTDVQGSDSDAGMKWRRASNARTEARKKAAGTP